MRADGHRTASEDIEQSLVMLGDPVALSFIRRLLIEAYFGAAFHWIAYGMQNAHGKHKENHSKLPTYLDSFGEHQMSQSWQRLESIRNGGWYGIQNDPAKVDAARIRWEEIRTWALGTAPTP